MSMYDPRGYPAGVPNPYAPAVELYPNYVHGTDYTRASFGMPYVRRPYNVLSGLGTSEEEKSRAKKEVLAMVVGIASGVAAGGLLAGGYTRQRAAQHLMVAGATVAGVWIAALLLKRKAPDEPAVLPPPPSEAPAPPPTSGLGQTKNWVYKYDRRFVWKGGGWVLDAKEEGWLEAGSLMEAMNPWPGMMIVQKPPPYYYADCWRYDGKWKSCGCYANWPTGGACENVI